MTHSFHKVQTEEPLPKKKRASQARLCFTKALGTVARFFLAESHQEPSVTRLEGRNGELFWKIYDFKTRQTFYCMTDDEAREWIEARRR